MKKNKLIKVTLATLLISQTILPITNVMAEQTNRSVEESTDISINNELSEGAMNQALETSDISTEELDQYKEENNYEETYFSTYANWADINFYKKTDGSLAYFSFKDNIKFTDFRIKVCINNKYAAEITEGKPYYSDLKNHDLFLKTAAPKGSLVDIQFFNKNVSESDWSSGKFVYKTKHIMGQTQIKTYESIVSNLFKDEGMTELVDGIDQSIIDNVKKKVNEIPSYLDKATLLNGIEKAQELLDNLLKPVYEITLITGNKKTIEYGSKFNPIEGFPGFVVSTDHQVYDSDKFYEGDYRDGVKPGVYSGNMIFKSIPQSEASFNLATPVTITVVDTQLSQATQLVHDLFRDTSFSELKGKISQEDIDLALSKVNNLPATSERNQLSILLEKAQELLDKQTDENKTQEVVNNLFGDKEHTTLANGVTQEDIDAAKDAANKVTDEVKKEELLNDIQKAQGLLDNQNETSKAEEAVNNLFGDKEHTTLANGVTQEDIDAAKDAANKVTDEVKKEELLNDIQKAQDLLNDSTKLTLDELTAASKMISGTAKPDSLLRISINDVAKTVIKADKEGKYSWKISKLVVNDVVKVEMKNATTNKFDQFVDQRITTSGVEVEKITLNALEAGDTKISGKTTPGGQVRISFDGQAKNVTTADAQGNYQFVVANGVKAGTEIKVELKSNGMYSVSAQTTVLEKLLTLNPILSADDVVITGKTRNPNQKLRISLNGKAKTIISSKEGVFEYRMGKLTADSVVKVEALEGSNVIEQIVKSSVNEERPDVIMNPIKAGIKTVVNGKAPADSVIRISLNGKAKTVVTADSEGNFSYLVGKVQSGDKVKVEIRVGKNFVFATEITAE